ncbi:hypothetical protein FRB95_014307 [Tulasnella sp. JGI-2019a]|nr:hypothetical protein FRB95_014307 [Tulasnella sp. JGI-2019a]
MYQVPPSSLGHHIRGCHAVGDWGKAKHWLTEAEETVLIDHIKLLGHCATPITPRGIWPDFVLGLSWVSNTKLDQACQNGLNPSLLLSFEDAVEKVYVLEKPEPGQIFGMDKTGLMLGTGPPQVVAGECHNHHGSNLRSRAASMEWCLKGMW